MKMSFVLALSILVSAFAQAGVLPVKPEPQRFHIFCSDFNGDVGYAVSFSPDGATAEIEENTIMGVSVVAKLSCPADRKPAPCCDRVSTTVCVDEQDRSAKDVGYEVELRTGGLRGIPEVTLHHGRAKVAQMECKYERSL